MVNPTALLTARVRAQDGPGCELVQDGFLAEPVSAWTSLAFVVAGVVVLVRARREGHRAHDADTSDHRPSARPHPLAGYAALVAAVGIGSFVQHGPDPVWSDLAHDLPLLVVLAYVGADAAADLTGRRPAWWWWAGPTLALVPLILLAPRAGDLAQVGVAVVAVALTVRRAVIRPRQRRRIATALALLAVGGTVGTLSRAGWPLCDPSSPLQGHAVWHVLAATALVVLAPTIGLSSHPPPRARR
ncbi:hypothetical protein GCM10010972_10720 [Cellulomonas carbonis]|uniref:Ceramidase n=1 Tax=Cellulomonas carbonis T26 TaxID=947969 RepID=A0A0A0BQY7_9CELL|nr:hypothetical protein N868_15495 [Cellulomonas carbonis T26]GGB99814.1 hypothetical protein GCM10010972_10720 [Cellulomonas carbonis]